MRETWVVSTPSTSSSHIFDALSVIPSYHEEKSARFSQKMYLKLLLRAKRYVTTEESGKRSLKEQPRVTVVRVLSERGKE